MRHGRPFLTLCVLLAVAGCDDSPSVADRRPTDRVVSDWRTITHQDGRYDVAAELVRDKHLIGMTRDDVVRLLGTGNERQMPATYGKLKYVVGASAVDDEWLCVHVENGKVVRTDVRPD